MAWAFVLAIGVTFASSARAGWEIEQRSYNLRSNGKTFSQQNATIKTSRGRVRVIEPAQVVIIDFVNDRFTLLAPEKKIFWSGSTQDYVRGMAAAYPRKRVDPAGLPTPLPVEVAILDTGIVETISGYASTRYQIKLAGKPLQDMWIAKDLDLSGDLDMKRLSGFQEVLRQAVRGKKNDQLAALYRNEDYLKLQQSGFPMRTENFLGNSILGREATKVTPAEIPESDFAPPADFTKTDLLSVLDAMGAPSQ